MSTTHSMDPMFTALLASQLQTIEDVLSNDESSSDEELVEFFIEEGIGVTPARQALAYRDRYLTTIYRQGQTPIRQGHDARRYDPEARRFIPV
nr:hypothetical protein [uncultured Halomonas sp.]